MFSKIKDSKFIFFVSSFLISVLTVICIINFLNYNDKPIFSHQFFGGGDAGHYYNLSKSYELDNLTSKSFCIFVGEDSFIPDPEIVTDMRGNKAKSINQWRYSRLDGYMSKFIGVDGCRILYPHANLYPFVFSILSQIDLGEFTNYIMLIIGLTFFGLVVGEILGTRYILLGIFLLATFPDFLIYSQRPMSEISGFALCMMSLYFCIFAHNRKFFWATYFSLFAASFARFEFLTILSLFSYLYSYQHYEKKKFAVFHLVFLSSFLSFFWHANYLHYQGLSFVFFIPLIISILALFYPIKISSFLNIWKNTKIHFNFNSIFYLSCVCLLLVIILIDLFSLHLLDRKHHSVISLIINRSGYLVPLFLIGYFSINKKFLNESFKLLIVFLPLLTPLFLQFSTSSSELGTARRLITFIYPIYLIITLIGVKKIFDFTYIKSKLLAFCILLIVVLLQINFWTEEQKKFKPISNEKYETFVNQSRIFNEMDIVILQNSNSGHKLQLPLRSISGVNSYILWKPSETETFLKDTLSFANDWGFRVWVDEKILKNKYKILEEHRIYFPLKYDVKLKRIAEM